MELRRGLIRDELELKSYILFILKHFYDPIPLETLTEVALDRVASYFELIAALDDLVRSEMVVEAEDPRTFQITVQGRFTLQAVEESLPYSTRLHTTEDIEKVIARTRRESSILTSVTCAESGYKAHMELSADHGPILKLELLDTDKGNAEKLVANFRENAEKIYLAIIDALTQAKS